jgi:hypothetical protein
MPTAPPLVRSLLRGQCMLTGPPSGALEATRALLRVISGAAPKALRGRCRPRADPGAGIGGAFQRAQPLIQSEKNSFRAPAQATKLRPDQGGWHIGCII